MGLEQLSLQTTVRRFKGWKQATNEEKLKREASLWRPNSVVRVGGAAVNQWRSNDMKDERKSREGAGVLTFCSTHTQPQGGAMPLRLASPGKNGYHR